MKMRNNTGSLWLSPLLFGYKQSVSGEICHFRTKTVCSDFAFLYYF